MKNLFNDISQEERKRILEMHENATKRNYLFEQGEEPTSSLQGRVIPRTRTNFMSLNSKEQIFPNLIAFQQQGNKPNDESDDSTDTQRTMLKVVTDVLNTALKFYQENGLPTDIPFSNKYEQIKSSYPEFFNNWRIITGEYSTGHIPLVAGLTKNVKLFDPYFKKLIEKEVSQG